jgi:hypothetical protein
MTSRIVPLADAPSNGVPGTKESLHWVAFHREYNGAKSAGAIVKFGGRLYIDIDKYLAWMGTGPRISPPVQRDRPAKVTKQSRLAAQTAPTP